MTNRLGRLLQERREALGYSRSRLAEAVGVAPGTLEGWELGRVAKPPIHDVLRLARFLRIELGELEAAVLDSAEETAAAPAPADDGPRLLERAIELLGWSEADAAAALGVPKSRLRAWRARAEPLPLPALLTVAALIGLRAADEAGVGAHIAALGPALDRPAAPPRRRQ